MKEVIIEIESCKRFIKSLTNNIKQPDTILTWFKELCALLADALGDITKHVRNDTYKLEENVKNLLLLYLTQLTALLSLLIQIFLKESIVGEVIVEARNCTKKQLLWCLDGLQEVLVSKSCNEDDKSFMQWMDVALDKLQEVDVGNWIEALNTCKEAQMIVEEVLGHAMSIAQVALDEDSKIIKGSSKAVLESLESLMQEISKSKRNIAMCNLFVDCCTDKLCLLERRVNEAVLKLCLQIFSDYTTPLDLLYDFCLNSKEKDENKLDGLIADFDLHVDRIMQVGLFAIASTGDNKRAIKMKSCLASLEALEVELVPAFTALTNDKSVHNLNLAFLLKNYWIHQAHTLQSLVYLIIDPQAFAGITYENIKQYLDSLIDKMKQNNYMIKKEAVREIIKEANVLKNMLLTSIDDLSTNNTVDIKKKLKDLKDILHEIKSSSEILLKDEKNSRENSLRILKRCKILLTVVQRLAFAFADDQETKTNVNKSMRLETKENIGIKTKELSKYETDERFSTNSLNKLISKGQQIIKDRSVLYKTPSKKKELHVPVSIIQKVSSDLKLAKNNALPLSKLVHFRKLHFCRSMLKQENNETNFDLQITDILNELTNLSSSLVE